MRVCLIFSNLTSNTLIFKLFHKYKETDVTRELIHLLVANIQGRFPNLPGLFETSKSLVVLTSKDCASNDLGGLCKFGQCCNLLGDANHAECSTTNYSWGHPEDIYTKWDQVSTIPAKPSRITWHSHATLFLPVEALRAPESHRTTPLQSQLHSMPHPILLNQTYIGHSSDGSRICSLG